MRPVPKRRHLIAVLLFAVVSGAMGLLATVDDHLSDAQIHVATAAAKRAGPHELYLPDLVYGRGELWRFSSPAFQGILELVLAPAGYADLVLPFRVLAWILPMIYLCGMYALLYRQCRSWSLAAFVAVMSTTVTDALGRAYWGVGPLSSITPMTLCMATIPLVMLSYLHYEDQPRLPLVFGAVGVLGNLHFHWAMNLALVLAMCRMARGRFRPDAIWRAVQCLAAAALGALPYAAYFLAMRSRLSGPEAADAETVLEAFELAGLGLLYPEVLGSLLSWVLVASVLLVPSLVVLLRVERFAARDLDLWVSFIVGSLVVSLGLHGLSQLVGRLTESPPPVIDFVLASAMAMLPLYVLLSQCLTDLFRLTRSHRGWLRALCGVLILAWMLPSDNLRVVRHAGYRALSGVLGDEQIPLRFQELQARSARRAEMKALADWAGGHTHRSDVFVFDHSEFRMRSRRALLVSGDDARYVYYLAPQLLGQWMELQRKQNRLTDPPSGQADLEAIAGWARSLAQREEFARAGQWYAVLPAQAVPSETTTAWEVASPRWGNHYRLFRLTREHHLPGATRDKDR
jgi:hypothetical protein